MTARLGAGITTHIELRRELGWSGDSDKDKEKGSVDKYEHTAVAADKYDHSGMAGAAERSFI